MGMSRRAAAAARHHNYNGSVLVWLSAVLILAMHAPRTSAQSCLHPLSAKVTIFRTDTLQCRDSTFSPDGSSNNTFIVWSLRDNSSGFVSMVVAAPLGAKQWAGLGFSGVPGQMIGSTALVATLGDKGVRVEQWYLKGTSESQVVRDSSRINFKAGPELIYDAQSTTVYIAFQIDFATSKAAPNFLLYAQGPATGVDNADLAQHTTRFIEESQFPVGATDELATSNQAKKVKAHGAMLVLGWGVLLPVGAMVARYAQGFDPTWFYIHITFQLVGFIFIIIGMAMGAQIEKSIDVPRLNGHKGLALFIFSLATLQVLAVVLRPHKDARMRKYWNWYHWWVGRLALFLACINIFVGFNLEKGFNKLKIGYIVILVFELVGFAILEMLYWIQLNQTTASGMAIKWNRSSTERGYQMSI